MSQYVCDELCPFRACIGCPWQSKTEQLLTLFDEETT